MFPTNALLTRSKRLPRWTPRHSGNRILIQRNPYSYSASLMVHCLETLRRRTRPTSSCRACRVPRSIHRGVQRENFKPAKLGWTSSTCCRRPDQLPALDHAQVDRLERYRSRTDRVAPNVCNPANQNQLQPVPAGADRSVAVGNLECGVCPKISRRSADGKICRCIFGAGGFSRLL